jgi:hypothetical protein
MLHLFGRILGDGPPGGKRTCRARKELQLRGRRASRQAGPSAAQATAAPPGNPHHSAENRGFGAARCIT